MSYSNGPRIVTDGLMLCLDAGDSKSYPGLLDILLTSLRQMVFFS